MGGRFRARTPENVVDEIEYWYQKGWNNFDINDDCFTFDAQRVERICELIILRKLHIHYTLYNGIRVDKISKNLLEKMKSSGCSFISFGVESGDNKILRYIGKGITVEKAKEAIKITNQIGIENSANFIIGHPEETIKEAYATLCLAKSIKTTYINIYNLIPYPGTELFNWVKQHGKFLYPPEKYLNFLSYGEARPIFETPIFKKNERESILKKGLLLAKKRHLESRLGKNLGKIIFLLSNFNPIWNLLNFLFFRYIKNIKIIERRKK
jgi:radical SAM superfamily enzyme YgiQ (UPF0313 family)